MEVYIDDMIVKSKAKRDHIFYLEKVFAVIRNYNMCLNAKKHIFGVILRNFLGYLISSLGIEANPDEIIALVKIRSSWCLKEVQ